MTPLNNVPHKFFPGEYVRYSTLEGRVSIARVMTTPMEDSLHPYYILEILQTKPAPGEAENPYWADFASIRYRSAAIEVVDLGVSLGYDLNAITMLYL